MWLTESPESQETFYNVDQQFFINDMLAVLRVKSYSTAPLSAFLGHMWN